MPFLDSYRQICVKFKDFSRTMQLSYRSQGLQVNDLNFRIQFEKLVGKMKKDTPRTVRVSEKTWQVIAQTSRP